MNEVRTCDIRPGYGDPPTHATPLLSLLRMGAGGWGGWGGAGANKPSIMGPDLFRTLRLRPVAVAGAAGWGPQPIKEIMPVAKNKWTRAHASDLHKARLSLSKAEHFIRVVPLSYALIT